MKTPALLTTLALALTVSSCVAKVGGTTNTSAPAGGNSAKQAEAASDNQHKLEIAQLKLQLAKMEAASGEASSQRSLASAELDAQLAAEALSNFTANVLPMETASTQLSLDRSRQRVKEAEQELSELEAMYAKEQFADLTKELVLSRGRSQLEMAKRSLELEQKRAKQTLEFDNPRKQRELTEKSAAATQALNEAKARAERGAIERKLSLMNAEHAVEEAQRAVDKTAESKG